MTTSPDPAPSATDARPLLAFRVGVSGHRNLADVDHAKLSVAVDEVFDAITRLFDEFAREPEAQRLYRSGYRSFRVVSSLAEGADRLVARAAVDKGWHLAAPIPFPRAEYEKDFPNSVEAFSALFRLAEDLGEAVELDGYRDPNDKARTDEGYLQAGRFVLRQSDLLIAIWDGEHANGTGGTGQIVAEAQQLGLPVAHINPATCEISLRLGEVTVCSFDTALLRNVLRAIVLPDWPRHGRHHLRAAETFFCKEMVLETRRSPDFLYAGPFVVPSPWSRMKLLFRLSNTENVLPDDPGPPDVPSKPDAHHPAALAYFLHFQRADALATHCASAHRTAFMAIYILGAVSVTAAFAHLLEHPPWIGRAATAIELTTLLAILVLVLAELHWRLRERWLDYRCLAELLRQADLLATVGRKPVVIDLDPMKENHPARGWVPWLVGAITRSAGIVGAKYDKAYLDSLKNYAVDIRFADQIKYHQKTSAGNSRIAGRLKTLSYGCFFSTLAIIAAELVFGVEWAVLPFLAGMFPVVSAASLGIRNQAEFEIVFHRSGRLYERLREECRRIRGLSGDRLTSVNLGRAIEQAAEVMRTDITDWAAIFEVKETELV